MIRINITNKFYLILLITFLISCQGQFSELNNEKNNLLMKSSKEFITEDGGHIDEEYGSTQEFEKQNFKIRYLIDTIYVETVQYVNACGDAKAWIELNGDSLILSTKEQAEELCASASWYKYEYWIKNPKNRKFIIRQK